MLLGSTGSGLKFRSFNSFVPWNSPQSTSSFLPAASTRYFDPVTLPAAPRNVSFAIALPFYRFPPARPPRQAPHPSLPTERADPFFQLRSWALFSTPSPSPPNRLSFLFEPAHAPVISIGASR